jgi:hypothetical protein
VSETNRRPARLCAASPAYAADGVVTPQADAREFDPRGSRSERSSAVVRPPSIKESGDHRQSKSLKLAPLASRLYRSGPKHTQPTTEEALSLTFVPSFFRITLSAPSLAAFPNIS